MRWPWTPRPEQRQTAADYTTLVSQLVAAQASGVTTDASKTAAMEAVAGLSVPDLRRRDRGGA